MRVGSQSGGAAVRLWTVALVLAVTATPIASASASERETDPSDPADVQSVEQTVPRPRSAAAPGVPYATSTGFWTWSKGGLGYFLTDATASLQHRGGYYSIQAVDLETGSTVARAPLDPPAYANASDSYAGGSDRSVVIDEGGGRVFVATQQRLFDNKSGNTTARVRGQEALCGSVPPNALGGLGDCLAGVTVLDAASLRTIRTIPLRKVRADNPQVSMELLRMAYQPASASSGDKLHLLVQETAHSAGGSGARQHSLVFVALIQIDVETGQEEWSLRLEPCRGNLTTSGSRAAKLEAARHQAAIFGRFDERERAVYVGCHFVSQTYQAGIVRIPLDEDGMPPVVPVPVPEDAGHGTPLAAAEAPDGAAEVTHARSDRVTWVSGPERVYEMVADPHSGRMLLQVLDGTPLAEVWWVLDTATMRFVGTVGIGGPTEHGASLTAVDRGRLYVLAKETTVAGRTFAGGLFVANVARTPVSQALVYPSMVDLFPPGYAAQVSDRWSLTVQVLPDGSRRLWYPDSYPASSVQAFRAFEDRRPDAELPPPDDFEGRTLDLDEAEGVTAASVDGAARGYGVRLVLVGGLEAALRAGPLDPAGAVDECNDSDWGGGAVFANNGPFYLVELNAKTLFENFLKQPSPGRGTQNANGGPCHYLGVPVRTPCQFGDREIVAAFVGPEGPAVVDGAGARGAAVPLRVDSLTAADAEAPASRCAGSDWDQLWASVLFGRAPTGEPRVPADFEGMLAQCVSGSEDSAVGDPVAKGYSAEVACDNEETRGHAYTRGFSLGGLNVAEALSSFRIYRDPDRGVVSRVESVARGVSLSGLLRIDTVRGVAESWANGRRQPIAREAREGNDDANCDMERTAGSCFTRHLFGVWTPHWSCGPCGDEHAFVNGVDGALNPAGYSVRLRDPDARLRQGAENGFAAAIQKPEADRFGDMVLNSDLLQTVLPTLEIIRQAPANRLHSRMGARGRQIIQLAGVEVSSSYGIQCLLVYDAESNTCAESALPPGSVRVVLEDGEGRPLAGGAFEVRADVDADGLVGLADELIAGGACVTAEDGIGTCVFEGLATGSYLVEQVAAPAGYAKTAQPWVSEVAPGEQRTVTFTNVSNVSMVELTVTDAGGAPLAGATFAAYPDPDSDGKVAPEAEPAAECTTDVQGVCSMSMAAGGYVLVQTGAPDGLAPIEPVAFAFASGGQVAALTVVNQPAGPVDTPQQAASPVYAPPVVAPPPVETVSVSEPARPDGALVPPRVSVPARVGGTVVQVVRAPGDALRLLARDPLQAIALVAALALFAFAVLAVRRRHQALALMA